MDTVGDFEDLLKLFQRHEVRYLIIGGLAFIFHARPRFTKDLDLWVDPDAANVRRANVALASFGSPYLLDSERVDEILQIGVAPNRVDLLRSVAGPEFKEAWRRRVEGPYGAADASWIALEDLIDIKGRIKDPRHQDDVRILRKVRDRNTQ